MKLERTASQRVLDLSIGENLDRLITVDTRGDGIARIIYDAARAIEDGPLTAAAAECIVTAVDPGDTVLILTGFLIPPSNVPETDGPIGAAVLARAIIRGLGGVPVFVGEPELEPVLRAAVAAAGLRLVDSLDRARSWSNSVAFVPFARDEADPEGLAARLRDELSPVLAIATERPGANPAGQYHFAGGLNVSSSIAPLDGLFARLVADGIPTVAIGDFGNELGMGAIAAVVKSETPAGGNCNCGCGGGTANEVPASVTLACSVSDWGAYAVSAALAHLTGEPTAFVDRQTYVRIAEAACQAGAIDGTSRLAVPAIDGVPASYHERLVEQLAEVVALLERPYLDNAGRAFRASRLFPAGR
ncbi:MAG TPA: glutamate cyclase domain-containing protein [Lacisediminihabitans sp.]|uniref:glutamate cyclase domain-containing protein n=1 Tax=Lacisediminihabitans sp. TaxID=2787631 RepID=UPI002ED9609F